MIIKSPTGLYKTILPRGTKSGNITFTISTNDPPRTNLKLIQYPVSEELTPAPPRIFTDGERRAQFGELIYTIAKNSRSVPGSNIKQFELGQILEFEDNPPEQELLSLQSPTRLDIQHNTNILDLVSLGLTEDEVASLISKSEEKQKELEGLFNSRNVAVKNLSTQISENQKKINETSKAIKATREVFDIKSSDLTNPNEIYQKLLLKQEEFEVERESLIQSHNELVEELKNISTTIRRVSELVK